MNKTLFDKFSAEIDKMDLASMTEEEKAILREIANKCDSKTGVSEHFKWVAEWIVHKYNCAKEEICNNVPYETVSDGGNIVTDVGAGLILDLIGGIDGATPADNARAVIYVGSNETAENAAQTGVITSLGSASIDATFPQRSGRYLTYQATFGGDDGNGKWREMALANGDGAGSIAINRRAANMGEKAANTTWIAELRLSIQIS